VILDASYVILQSAWYNDHCWTFFLKQAFLKMNLKDWKPIKLLNFIRIIAVTMRLHPIFHQETSSIITEKIGIPLILTRTGWILFRSNRFFKYRSWHASIKEVSFPREKVLSWLNTTDSNCIFSHFSKPAPYGNCHCDIDILEEMYILVLAIKLCGFKSDTAMRKQSTKLLNIGWRLFFCRSKKAMKVHYITLKYVVNDFCSHFDSKQKKELSILSECCWASILGAFEERDN